MLSNDWTSKTLSPKLSGSCGAQKASAAADRAGCIHTSSVFVLHNAGPGLQRNAVAISQAAACAERPTSAVATSGAQAAAACCAVSGCGSRVCASCGGGGVGAFRGGGGVRVFSGTGRPTPAPAGGSVSGSNGGAAVLGGGAGDSASVSPCARTGAPSSASSLVSLTWLRSLSASESCAGEGMCVLSEPGFCQRKNAASLRGSSFLFSYFQARGLSTRTFWRKTCLLYAGCHFCFCIFKYGANYCLP